MATSTPLLANEVANEAMKEDSAPTVNISYG